MDYLDFSAVTIGSIVMIDFPNGKEAFLISNKLEGYSKKGSMLCGNTLDAFIKKPNLYPIFSWNEIPIFPWDNEGKIVGCRNLTPEEKEGWVVKIEKIPKLKELVELLS